MLSEYFSTGSFGQYSDQESEAVAVARQSGASVLPLFKAVTIATAIKGTLSLYEPLTTYSLHDDFAKTDGEIAAARGRPRVHSHSDPPHPSAPAAGMAKLAPLIDDHVGAFTTKPAPGNHPRYQALLKALCEHLYHVCATRYFLPHAHPLHLLTAARAPISSCMSPPTA